MPFKINWDALGIATSLACALHCAILPLVISTLPVFGINIIDNQWFEYFMILLSLILGIAALRHGYQKHHQSRVPLLLFSFGILLMLLKQSFHEWQLWLLIPGFFAIVLAHLRNFQLCRSAENCDSTAA